MAGLDDKSLHDGEHVDCVFAEWLVDIDTRVTFDYPLVVIYIMTAWSIEIFIGNEFLPIPYFDQHFEVFVPRCEVQPSTRRVFLGVFDEPPRTDDEFCLWSIRTEVLNDGIVESVGVELG